MCTNKTNAYTSLQTFHFFSSAQTIKENVIFKSETNNIGGHLGAVVVLSLNEARGRPWRAGRTGAKG